MLDINQLQDRKLMEGEMSRRFAQEEYLGFIHLYETLVDSGSIDAQNLMDLARVVTLGQLSEGIQQGDQLLTLVDKYLRLPNIAAPEVPVGENCKGDVVVFTADQLFLDLPKKPRSYVELGTELNIFNPEKSVDVAREGFPFVFGAGASLDRALMNLMLDTHV